MTSLLLLAAGHQLSTMDAVVDFAIVAGAIGLVIKVVLTTKLFMHESPEETIARKREEAARAKKRAIAARRDVRRTLVSKRNVRGGGVWRGTWSTK